MQVRESTSQRARWQHRNIAYADTWHDDAHLRAKEEGTAAGRAKKDSSMRPPARLFTEAEARKHNLSFERSRQDRRLGDVVDVLCGVHKLKDGYYVKTISMASCCCFPRSKASW